MAAAPPDITAQLAHHDAAITALGGRMSGVETGLRTLQGEVHHGFVNVTQTVNQQIGALSSKLDKLDAAPKLDLHKSVGTVVALAVLFSMICAGIIWITTSQFSGVIAEQKSLNQTFTRTLEKHDKQIDDLRAWSVTIERAMSTRGAQR